MGDFDVIVIGGGIAGMSSAKKAKDHGLSVLLLEALYTGGKTVKTDVISDYPGFPDGISGERLTDLLEEAVRSRGVKILHEAVTKMELSAPLKHIVTDRDSYTTPSVIIATGIRQREIGLTNERALSGMGVFHSAEREGFRVAGKTVAVFGSGNSAVTEALILSEKCEKVYLISPNTILGASKKYTDELRRSKNITLCPESLIANAEEGVFLLESVTVINRVTTEFRTIPIEAIFVAPMPEPDSDVLLGCVRMTDDGAVITGGDLSTSAEGVYAAGAVREGSSYTVIDAISDGFRAADSVNTYLVEKVYNSYGL
ncbi:MAG: NAD(P)/FAD-dependent oxidoreductase [Clostridia bacterium]|nr:NAD(P)/FAD-dependent oxidoreductase [Clostridia bacterium]